MAFCGDPVQAITDTKGSRRLSHGVAKRTAGKKSQNLDSGYSQRVIRDEPEEERQTGFTFRAIYIH